ncbi:thiamine diphosphokinase [Enterococcus sp. LJL51]|uniref:thiamine diphosphokinase n=1 Tax=Enterococcus sp. LJL51 TaxID=3416656 RepID=UPI003CFAB0AB
MKVLIVAGGSSADWPPLEKTDYDFFTGVDRGSLFILENNWPLDLAVGDFDSLSNQEKQLVKKEAKEFYPAQVEKDDTDTQLALAKVLEQMPNAEITIIGAAGGRLDHFLANLWLPLEPRFQPFIRQIHLKNQQNTISYYLPGEYTVYREPEMSYLAYCCLTAVSDLTLKDSRYLLHEQQVPVPTSYASNEFIGDTASFTFTAGVIAVIQSKD